MSRRSSSGLAASPLLVGAVTVLITLVAVFISYNANSGLPFVPTYKLIVDLPDGGGLQAGREVRSGGARIGVVEEIDAIVSGDKPTARLTLKLEKRLAPFRADSVVAVRPLSPLGLKYLDLAPGRRGRFIGDGGRLPLRQARASVDLATTLGSFEAGTRSVGKGEGGSAAELARRGAGLVGLGTALAGPVAALAGVAPASAELGTGLAGRGADLNLFVEQAPALLRGVERVSGNLADSRTRLRGLLRGADRFTGELASVRAELGSLVAAGDTTFGALAEPGGAVGEIVDELPGTEAAGTEALRAASPVLADAADFLRDARPGLDVLRPAVHDLNGALDLGVPVLQRTPALARRLETALGAVDRLARDPASTRTLEKLRATLASLGPTVDFVAPAQTRCNYIGLFLRNATSAVSEGDASGNWLRFIGILQASEMLAEARPAADLHVNPYANTGAPSQGGECEAGKEPYLPGQRIGHVPGFQGGSTESTSRETTIPPPHP
jgi:virulence factor Mce-like protein